ncbi:GNAT family N-acetyltransferase [Murimonas intestini]|uniref:GNAT family N-acetyltransferase n=1 Tax=Murimonas intestini TaxID=1337051 RepID=UPI0011DE0D26|nr:GNAT family N-acetyltransferase [Murimonas intestini]
MELQYRGITEKDAKALKVLLHRDEDNIGDFLDAVENETELITAAYLGTELVGVIQLAEDISCSYLAIFVDPDWRGRGIGSEMLAYAQERLYKFGTESIMTSFNRNDGGALRFARKHGFNRNFSSSYMEYTGGRFELEELPVRGYRDDDYIESQKLIQKAFYEMNVRVGDFPDAKIEEPNEEEQRDWAENASGRFVYTENGRIAGFGHISDNEIEGVAVRSDLQGQGIGRKMTMYLCNQIFDRGYNSVILWCVTGNYARKLYDSLGFHEKYTAEFARKKI